MEELLRMEHITKQFGSVYANRDINLDVRRGEVHTLLGENGAGKSTLMNVLFGLYQPTAGKIYLNGEAVKIASPAEAVKKGIGMVHQHFMLVEAMTVLENIILGDRRTKGLFIDKDARRKEILELAERYGLDVELDKPITEIAVGAQQRVEILKALYRGAELLVLDEPTAALTDIETEGLFAIIEKLKSENKSVIFISHKMREVMKISDRVTVLRAGQTVCTLDCRGTDSCQLANLMIGRDLAPSRYEKIEKPGEPVMELTHVSFHKSSKHNGLNDVSLTVGRGEIVGIAGVDGNGQSQLAQIVTGVLTPAEGVVDLKGSTVARFTPNGFILENVSHIPEDRNKMGLIGNMSVQDNLVLKNTEESRFSDGHGLHLKKKAIHDYALGMQEKYDIRCESVDQECRNLSGGNQQKVILARELEGDPDLLVAVHPTRGLDIGATRYVHDSMIDARTRGCGVLLISADFDEVLEVSDRIIVMFEGQIMGVYSGKNPPIEEIGLAMAGK
ncbi:ABC transporter ATP-binding protein [Oscillibacter sp.]|uniref:ABC transporter ATP-binding protein n=1 Tax=Oscillibacter sp. TaxID=1945593 RepID=UPI0028AB1DA4|nr:ABC transporter ATP-binding protein [Oscillibacter sp.]